jgi:hypothetical protein
MMRATGGQVALAATPEGKRRFSFGIEYQPTYARHDYDKAGLVQETYILGLYRTILRKIQSSLRAEKIKKYSYDQMWSYVLKRKPENDKMIPGAFVDWDNSPRRHKRGTVYCKYRFLRATLSEIVEPLQREVLSQFVALA